MRIEELEWFGPRLRRALQIADFGPHPILRFGPTTTRFALGERLGRLHFHRHFTADFSNVNHAHMIEAEHCLGQPTTVSHRRDLLAVEVIEQLQLWRDPCTHRVTLTPSSLSSST
jgi:hypothetical protein